MAGCVVGQNGPWGFISLHVPMVVLIGRSSGMVSDLVMLSTMSCWRILGVVAIGMSDIGFGMVLVPGGGGNSAGVVFVVVVRSLRR